MKTVYVGLSRATFNLPQQYSTMDSSIQEIWERRVENSLQIRNEIIEVLKTEDECGLKLFHKDGMQYALHCQIWESAMPDYRFVIGGNECIVKKKE